MNVRSAEIENHQAKMCCAKQSHDASLPKVPARQWEKKLQQETSEKSVDVIVRNAEEQEKLYFQSLHVFGRLKTKYRVVLLYHLDSSISSRLFFQEVLLLNQCYYKSNLN